MTYRVGSFNIACDDMHRYLAAKYPSIDKYLVDVIQNVFIEGEELDFTLVKLNGTMPASITPLAKLPPIVTPLGDLPPTNVPTDLIILLPTGQIEDIALVEAKLPST